MKESAFSFQLRKDIYASIGKKHKPHVYLIQDSYRSGKKPYDFYFLYGKYFYAIECKVCKGMSLNFDMVLQNQIDSLFEVEKCGSVGRGYVAIFLEKYDKKKTLIIPVFHWVALLKTYAQDAKSIKIEEFINSHPDWYEIMERRKVDNHLQWDAHGAIVSYEKRY